MGKPSSGKEKNKGTEKHPYIQISVILATLRPTIGADCTLCAPEAVAATRIKVNASGASLNSMGMSKAASAGESRNAITANDIDKLEGMETLLDRQNQVLVGDSPLSSIKFRPGAEDPSAGTPVNGGDDGDKDGDKPSHRPYSFQQRRNKKL